MSHTHLTSYSKRSYHMLLANRCQVDLEIPEIYGKSMENLWKIYEPTPPTDQLNGRCHGKLHLASAGDERHLSHGSGKSSILIILSSQEFCHWPKAKNGALAGFSAKYSKSFRLSRPGLKKHHGVVPPRWNQLVFFPHVCLGYIRYTHEIAIF